MDKQHNSNYKIVDIRDNKYHIYDLYYNGDIKRCYGTDVNELKEKVKSTMAKLINDYKSKVPSSSSLVDIVDYFIYGLKLFRLNVFDEENMVIGDLTLTLTEAEHYNYILENIIKRCKLNSNIEELKAETIEKTYEQLTHFYSYDIIEELSFLINYSFKIARFKGLEVIDYKTVKMPESYEGITKDREHMKKTNEILYFLNKRELDCIMNYCKESSLRINHSNKPFKGNTDILMITLNTGLAPKEIIDLPYNCIDIQNSVIHYNGKDIPIDKAGVQWLKDMEFINDEKFAESDKKFGISFRGNSKPFTRIIRSIRNITKHLALPQFTSTGLVYSYALIKMQEGTTAKELSETITDFNENLAATIKKKYLKFKETDFKTNEETR